MNAHEPQRSFIVWIGAQSRKCKFGTNHRVDIQNHGPGEDELASEYRQKKQEVPGLDHSASQYLQIN